MISFDQIAEQLDNKELLAMLGQKVGAKPEQVQMVAKMGLPTIMEALNRNSNDSAGAESLLMALDGHSGSDLSDLSGFLGGVDMDDGAKVLGHILGNKTSNIESRMGQKAGLGKDQVAGLLMQFAPLVLSFLGNKKKEEGLNEGGLSDLTAGLSGLFGSGGNSGGTGNLLSLATSLLDKDDDDDDGGLLGGLLGKLF